MLHLIVIAGRVAVVSSRVALRRIRRYRQRLAQEPHTFHQIYLQQFQVTPAPDLTAAAGLSPEPTDAAITLVLLQRAAARQHRLRSPLLPVPLPPRPIDIAQTAGQNLVRNARRRRAMPTQTAIEPTIEATRE